MILNKETGRRKDIRNAGVGGGGVCCGVWVLYLFHPRLPLRTGDGAKGEIWRPSPAEGGQSGDGTLVKIYY